MPPGLTVFQLKPRRGPNASTTSIHLPGYPLWFRYPAGSALIFFFASVEGFIHTRSVRLVAHVRRRTDHGRRLKNPLALAALVQGFSQHLPIARNMPSHVVGATLGHGDEPAHGRQRAGCLVGRPGAAH